MLPLFIRVGVDDETEVMQLHMRSVSDNDYISNEPNGSLGHIHDVPYKLKQEGHTGSGSTTGALDTGATGDSEERTENQLLVLDTKLTAECFQCHVFINSITVFKSHCPLVFAFFYNFTIAL